MAFAGGGTDAGSGLNALLTVGLEETAWGTASAAEMWPGLVTELQLIHDLEVYTNWGAKALRTANALKPIKESFGIIMKGEVDCGVPLAMVMGSISATSNPRLDILRGKDDTAPTKAYLPSWTLRRTYKEAADRNLSILGATFNKGTFNIDLDGPFTFSLEGIGKSQGTNAATQLTAPGAALGSWSTTLKVKEGATSYASSGAVTVDGWDNINWLIDNSYYVRSQPGTAPAPIRQPVPLKVPLTLTIGRGAIDPDLWNDLVAGAVESFEVAVTDGTRTITTDFNACYGSQLNHTMTMTAQSREVAKFQVQSLFTTVSGDGVTYVVYG